MGTPQAGRLEPPDVYEIPITQYQATALLDEFVNGREDGTLRYALGADVLVGDADHLGRIRYRLEVLADVASAVGDNRRANHLTKVAARIADQGINPVNLAGRLEPPIMRTSLPETVKREHPSTRRRRERIEAIIAEARAEGIAPSDALYDEAGFGFETLRRGRAQGRNAGKRAFSRNAQPRASKTAGIVRGDRVFNHDEYVVAEGRVTVISRPNDERSAWLRAGSDPGDRAKGRDLTKQGRQSIARETVKEDLDSRIARAVVAAHRRHGRVRPSWIADELVREDITAGKYKSLSGMAGYMRKRYTRAVWKREESLPTPPPRERKPVTRKRRQRFVRVESARRTCEHAWRVTPARVKRTCTVCGVVHRKQRGRWVEYAGRQEPPVEDPPAPVLPEPEPYKLKPRGAKRVAARRQLLEGGAIA